MILKEGSFSDLKILEIYQQINRDDYQQESPTQTETLNIDKTQIKLKQKIINTPHQYNKKITQDDKINVELMKKITTEKKTTLPSLRNEWKKSKKMKR